MNELPSGTVTFLFTDIEGSTKLWEQFPEEMRTALENTMPFCARRSESNHGHIVKTTGDGVLAVLKTPLMGYLQRWLLNRP